MTASCTWTPEVIRRDGKDEMAVHELLSIGATFLAVVVPAIWTVSVRMARFESRISTGLAKVDGKLGEIDKDLGYVKDELKNARAARSELWQEVNRLRERSTRMSTIMKLPEK